LRERWAHLDMFLVRDTLQQNLEELIYTDSPHGPVLWPFFAAQFRQFKRTLLAHRPRVIVVANRAAGRVLERELARGQPARFARIHTEGLNHICQWADMPNTLIVLAPTKPFVSKAT
jgi:hypothetical protein